MAVALAQYLKYSLCTTGDNILLSDELKQIESYFNMLKIKYEDAFTYSITAKKEIDMLKYYQSENSKLGVEKGTLQGQIINFERQIERIEAEMKSQEVKSEENKKWRERVDLAEALYTRLKNDFEVKKNKTFLELNGQIQKNFERMFNAKDKRIQLTENYEIQMLYQTDLGFREEKNLSEGEKIARNFAFIVTIMEYSRNKKAEHLGVESGGDTLPIVLDGPFSKLGDKNISLI